MCCFSRQLGRLWSPPPYLRAGPTLRHVPLTRCCRVSQPQPSVGVLRTRNLPEASSLAARRSAPDVSFGLLVCFCTLLHACERVRLMFCFGCYVFCVVGSWRVSSCRVSASKYCVTDQFFSRSLMGPVFLSASSCHVACCVHMCA